MCLPSHFAFPACVACLLLLPYAVPHLYSLLPVCCNFPITSPYSSCGLPTVHTFLPLLRDLGPWSSCPMPAYIPHHACIPSALCHSIPPHPHLAPFCFPQLPPSPTSLQENFPSLPLCPHAFPTPLPILCCLFFLCQLYLLVCYTCSSLLSGGLCSMQYLPDQP